MVLIDFEIFWLSFCSLTCLQVSLVGPDNKPVVNETVYLFTGDTESMTLTTDMKGMASFALDTTLWKHSVHLKVGNCLPEYFFPRRIHSVAGLCSNQLDIFQLYNYIIQSNAIQ